MLGLSWSPGIWLHPALAVFSHTGKPCSQSRVGGLLVWHGELPDRRLGLCIVSVPNSGR